MSETFPLLVENFAPWLTAIGAFAFGILSHKRSKTTAENDKFQKTIEELHGLYHNLVSDLAEQVERVTSANETFVETNKQLANTVDELTTENADLKKAIKDLTKQIRSLKAQVAEMSEAHEAE